MKVGKLMKLQVEMKMHMLDIIIAGHLQLIKVTETANKTRGKHTTVRDRDVI